jgi:membrane protein implicated in regulation of membrane protease activity
MMSDWDLASVGLVLIGSSITAAGIIIATMLLGVTVPGAPFLLLTATILIVLSAALIIYGRRNEPPA